ncbi:MAG TPA: DUF1080 domain-containing protein, partial [Pirellulaceae bacterium]|nr:DUF1080 domain-containing protein [Pirellulaceae bacterium]
EPVGVRVPLFDGKTLQGWHVTGCEAAVENGVLVIKEGNGLLRTDHRYRDFILEISYKPRQAEKYDSGIYIRGELPPEGKPFPSKHQINLKQGDEANLIGFKEARSTGLVKPGEWNQLKVTVIGETVAMVINGQPAWQTSGLKDSEGYIGIQVEVPLGGQYEFKEIAVTELGYTSLFNGKDLTGWEGANEDAAKCWQVVDGLLECTGKKGPWLRSQQEYGDYNLRLAYKLKEGGNSGVFIRVPKNGEHHGDQSGIEIQLLDDRAPRYDKLKAYQYTGSLYAIVAADPRVAHEAGEWNTMEIDCRDRQYRIIHNGVLVLSANAEQHPELAKRLTSGFLGLQNHSEQVWFRDLRIGPSQQAEPIAAK